MCRTLLPNPVGEMQPHGRPSARCRGYSFAGGSAIIAPLAWAGFCSLAILRGHAQRTAYMAGTACQGRGASLTHPVRPCPNATLLRSSLRLRCALGPHSTSAVAYRTCQWFSECSARAAMFRFGRRGRCTRCACPLICSGDLVHSLSHGHLRIQRGALVLPRAFIRAGFGPT